LCARERPWLRALGLRRLDRHGDALLEDSSVLGASLPNLTHLDLSGTRLLDELDHAGVSTLVVTGESAIPLFGNQPLSSITTLDFAFEPDVRRSGLHHWITRARLPNVRRLGLSRQEPNEPLDLPNLIHLDLSPQLTHLELPSLRSQADVTAVELAADRMPNLRDVVIARAYMCFGDRRVELARARVHHPEPWPWPPLDQFDLPRLYLLGEHASGLRVIDALEQVYDQLSPAVRASWFRIWTTLESARWIILPRIELLAALEALGLEDPEWEHIHRALQASSDDSVHVAFSDGFLSG
jgi:hypothetical protein